MLDVGVKDTYIEEGIFEGLPFTITYIYVIKPRLLAAKKTKIS